MPAIGQADIVENDVDLLFADDLADRAFDLGEIALPYPRASWPAAPGRAGASDPRSTCGKKSRPTIGKSASETDHKGNEKQTCCAGPRDGIGDAPSIGFAEIVEAPLEALMNGAERVEAFAPARRARIGRLLRMARRTDQEFEQDRHERERERQAGDQGQADRHGQRRKQIFGRALEQKDRDEDDTYAQGRDHGRHADLARAVDDRPSSAVRAVSNVARCSL